MKTKLTSEKDIEFYDDDRSVEKECIGCGRIVEIPPEDAYCLPCIERLKSGRVI